MNNGNGNGNEISNGNGNSHGANANATPLNIGQNERMALLAGGLALAGLGLLRKGLFPVLMTAVGGGLVYSAITGHNPLYRLIGKNTAIKTGSYNVAVPEQQGVHITKVMTINRPAADLFNFWRNFENLPRIMHHLESVKVINQSRSNWKAKAPAGMTVEWDAEIISEQPNELIAWRSLPDSQVPNAGSVRFKQLPDGRGTEVKVQMEYAPPAGQLGAIIAKLFGEEPDQQIGEDLFRFKQMMETGEVSTIDGQSSGRSR